MNTTTAAKAPRNRVIAFHGPENAPLDTPVHAIIRKAGDGAVVVSTVDGIITEYPSAARIAWGPIADAPDAQYCGKCGEPMWFGPAVKDVYCRPCYNGRAREIASERKDPEKAVTRDPVAERMDRVMGALRQAEAKSRADLIAATLRNLVAAQADYKTTGYTRTLATEAWANAFAAAAATYGLTVAQANTLIGSEVPEPTMTPAQVRKAARRASDDEDED